MADADDADLYAEFKPDDATHAAHDGDGDGDGDGSDDRCVWSGAVCWRVWLVLRYACARASGRCQRGAVRGGVHTGMHREGARSMCVRVCDRVRALWVRAIG